MNVKTHGFTQALSLLCIWILVLFAPAVSAQNNALQQIFNQLGGAPLVRAQFEQQKKLVSLNKTYSSKGQILFNKNQGVLWQIQRPVVANLVVTPHKLVQKTQRTSTQVEVDKTPYGSVATMFLQLMSGNQAALAKNFNVVSANYSARQWNAVLTPKSPLLKKLFVRVDIQGQEYIDRITIQEQANNQTVIRFSQHSTQPQTLTTVEHALFQLAK